MRRQLPLRLLAGGIVALMWGFVTQDTWFGGGVLVITTTSTASRVAEPFATKFERALLISVTLALVRLYAMKNLGR
jgi:hypothetical protein